MMLLEKGKEREREIFISLRFECNSLPEPTIFRYERKENIDDGNPFPRR